MVDPEIIPPEIIEKLNKIETIEGKIKYLEKIISETKDKKLKQELIEILEIIRKVYKKKEKAEEEEKPELERIVSAPRAPMPGIESPELKEDYVRELARTARPTLPIEERATPAERIREELKYETAEESKSVPEWQRTGGIGPGTARESRTEPETYIEREVSEFGSGERFGRKEVDEMVREITGGRGSPQTLRDYELKRELIKRGLEMEKGLLVPKDYKRKGKRLGEL